MTDYLSTSVEEARLCAAQFDHTNETNILQNSTFDRYTQKGNFDVMNTDINEWAICLPSPSFLPDSPMIDFLENGYFASAVVEDECNLLVTLRKPINSVQDEDYIRESFDIALDWLPKYKVAEIAFCEFKHVEDIYQIKKKRWENAQAAFLT
jgi:hypothetical protein